ncbi:hybrid sensor histidine kinase/response regulator [Pigmentiphaga litoralis]|uniref:Virulence sensor protein BvgS n=1 Tax=Pigmentiphaga litoralis TaxID=516702 RepID=A0A7Y9LPU9_9BURK|nr:response regulator [Pigmentiphaga litoralis]NYE21769.1 CheY-like chemotaxis protein [Pigmentiphaga litoralis]NYE84616.1 CheY-like chemotaxis protein [Pigmentiphaga litoralis]
MKLHQTWLGDVSLLAKVSLVVGLLIGLFALSSAGTALVEKEQQDIQQATRDTTLLLREVNRATRFLFERQYEMRQILFSGLSPDTTLYDAADQGFHDVLHKIIEAARGDALQSSRLDRVVEVDRRWISTVSTPIITAVKAAWQQDGSLSVTERERIFQTASANSTTRTPDIIQLMDQVAQVARDGLEERERRLDDTEMQRRWLSYGSLVLALLGGAAALWLSVSLITRPLRQLADLMTRLARHDHDIDIPAVGRRDEVGVIARALEAFKAMAIETADQNWIKSGIASVSTRLQRVDTHRDYANTLLSEVAPLLNAGAGLLYLHDTTEERLVRTGSYGYRAQGDRPDHYAIGEGLVGQCAAERKPLAIADVPPGYLDIHSGSGQASPRHVLLLPVVSRERLLAVIELASFSHPTSRQQRLLDALGPLVALSLDNITRAVRTRELLEQTQAQAGELRASEEELRTQQEELQASNEELRQKSDTLNQQKSILETLQQETQSKAEALTRANQYKSEFLANMSHELRTPLNSLLILSNDLAENGDGNLSGDQVESARIIHESGSNLLRLINDILDLSKIEAGKMDLLLEPVDLTRFASTLKRNFNRIAKDKQVDFTVLVDDGMPPSVVGDGGKLEQVASNLLSNAFKFTRLGAVHMRIGRPYKDYPGFDSRSTVAIEVTDTGIGIPDDKLGRVFGAFEQVDASTSRQYGGTGLGLAISRQLMKLHHGDIVLHSELGQGSTFTMLLPDTQPATPQTATGQGDGNSPATADSRTAPRAHARSEGARFRPMPAAPLPTLSATAVTGIIVEDDRQSITPGDTAILVIEDDPAFARILTDLIRRKGLKALAAGDGEAGLHLARTYRPTGILLDVMLPSMDGWSVIEHLKADPAVRHIPVHFISALDESARGRELGAVGFLTKPVTSEALTGAFERLLHFKADNTRRLLVVDDDPISRAAVRKLVASPTVEVIESASAEDALAKLNVLAYDCIVLDLGLPGMSGFDFLEQMRSEAGQAPVVVYSARELTREESLRIREHTDSIVIKGARSPERLIDEVSLFLHSINQQGGAAREDTGEELVGRKVLVVDDDMRNIFALSKVLRAKGLEVSLAQDGQKALKVLDESPDIELVLMDVMMPVMDGYETIQEIRKDPRFGKLPIISLTAKAMRGDREKSLAAGANDYLSKPIDIPKLLSMMRVWLP